MYRKFQDKVLGSIGFDSNHAAITVYMLEMNPNFVDNRKF